MDPLVLVRLLQLASPALPVGAFSYSQGLEWAVDSGAVRDEASAGEWIGELLTHAVGHFEAPLLAAQMTAWRQGDQAELARLNDDFVASRESMELRAETVQMGYSLHRLIVDLRDPGHVASLTALRDGLAALPTPLAFPTAWSGLAAAWGVPPEAAVSAYLWSWAENQVMAALKSVPLGQAAGQRLLAALAARIPEIAARALRLPEAAWANFAPAFAITSARHETQYSRLFRS